MIVCSTVMGVRITSASFELEYSAVVDLTVAAMSHRWNFLTLRPLVSMCKLEEVEVGNALTSTLKKKFQMPFL